MDIQSCRVEIDKITSLYQEIAESAPPNGLLIIGIDGCGGSGKSTIARALEGVATDVVVVEMDDFYKTSQFRQSTSTEVGSDFDWMRLRDQVLLPLRKGVAGSYQRYDWDTDSLAGWQTLPLTGIVLIEGVYVTRKELRSLYDLRLWVETPAAVRLDRGLIRDGEGARHTWVHEWMPAEELYAKDHKPNNFADIKILGNHPNVLQPEMYYARCYTH